MPCGVNFYKGMIRKQIETKLLINSLKMIEIFNLEYTIDIAWGRLRMVTNDNDNDKKAQKSKLIAWVVAIIAVALFALSFYLGAGTQ